MEITVTRQNARLPVTIMHLSGDLDSSTANEFKQKAQQLIADGAKFILVDFTKTPYVSSAGFRVLHELFNELRALHPEAGLSDEEVRKGISAGTYSSPHLKMLNMSRETRKTFEMTGFDMYIEAYNDLQQAVASF
jgi:anti-anti-sigma factor